ncbi:isocitrate/isopropylmalate dehydrogenase family protein [Acetonema longum]|uniref:Isocitrate dehydrogenase, NAD-dependent n=1 Tax=Acetonema longum DSM 6540 TaxID=1009370 RepID=F7NGK8_9FIRM|nr:isocitrate/isopropylmalate dehydrogenase family protein [Acetonema longum]EGO64812.1 isocitrate dehydrogenase, NAD-dependent [Acetonema longum DSM 6540]
MYKIGVIEGNGIGPEQMQATKYVLEATGLPFQWVDIPVAQSAMEKYGHPLPQESVKKLRELKVNIKGPLMVDRMLGRITCVHDDGSSEIYPSINNAIRRELNLFVSPRPIKGFPGISGKHADMDVVIMREITEDIYIGWEHQIGDMAAEAIKVTTREAVTRVTKFSFDYARKYNRKKVTCVHKANALSISDGFFLKCFMEVAANYLDIEADDYFVDAVAFNLAKFPKKYDVLVASNQYGDILSDLAGGLAGSLGLAPGANIGENVAIFEATHGAAPDIAGKGLANPISLILSGAAMLRHIGCCEEADNVENATRKVLSDGKVLTPDLNGTAKTMELAEAIAKAVHQ